MGAYVWTDRRHVVCGTQARGRAATFPVFPSFIVLSAFRVRTYWIFSRIIYRVHQEMQDGIHVETRTNMRPVDWQVYRNMSLQPYGFGEERVRIW